MKFERVIIRISACLESFTLSILCQLNLSRDHMLCIDRSKTSVSFGKSCVLFVAGSIFAKPPVSDQ